jgi:hypothetical protein
MRGSGIIHQALEPTMGQAIPVGRIGAHQTFEYAMVATAEVSIRIRGSLRIGDLDHTKPTTRQQGSEKNRNGCMADQEVRQGVHGKIMAEKRGGVLGVGGSLIPKKSEAVSFP